MTMAEFYESSISPIEKLAAFAMENGNYDENSGGYVLFLGESILRQENTPRYLIYLPEEDIVVLATYLYEEYVIFWEFDMVSDAYYYTLINLWYEEILIGCVEADMLHRITAVPYTWTNIEDQNIIGAYMGMACYILQHLVECMDADFADIGVTAESLGFVGY